MPILRHIYDSATSAYVDVEVTQEVYDCYRRTAWIIQKKTSVFMPKRFNLAACSEVRTVPLRIFPNFALLMETPSISCAML